MRGRRRIRRPTRLRRSPRSTTIGRRRSQEASSPTEPMRLLILGGTTEASALARRITGRRDLAPILSFAGRTRAPVPPPIPFRTGGFGGVTGLKQFLLENGIEAVID